MKRIAIALTLLLTSATVAQAHFVWLVSETTDGGKAKANVYFAELAETDDASLLDRITKVKVWSRDAAGQASEPLSLTKEEHKDGGGALVSGLKQHAALSGTIKYGVLERGDNVFLLNYHAKFLDAGAGDLSKLARDEALILDVVPHLAGEKSQLEVLWQGKPIKDSEVIVIDPSGKEHDVVKTDDQGKVTVDLSKPGLYSIRAKLVVEDKGELNGKKYEKANHYSTLTLRVPPKAE